MWVMGLPDSAYDMRYVCLYSDPLPFSLFQDSSTIYLRRVLMHAIQQVFGEGPNMVHINLVL